VFLQGLVALLIGARPPSTFISWALAAAEAMTIAPVVMNARLPSFCVPFRLSFLEQPKELLFAKLIAPSLQVSMQSMQATQRL
jgi:hypothetical protein